MSESLKQLLDEHEKGISEELCSRILKFYEIILEENEIQNLTRLTTPEAFYQGHIRDVLELLKTGWIDYPALDLGSGVGIPGLMAALLEKGQWVLAESEKRKAEYLENAVVTLEMAAQVRVVAVRGEEYLKNHRVGSVIARAVGPVDRMYGWIRSCSTWNNMILFKGPGWDEEWDRIQKSKYKNELKIQAECSYEVKSGLETRSRKLVLVSRVPRGTK